LHGDPRLEKIVASLAPKQLNTEFERPKYCPDTVVDIQDGHAPSVKFGKRLDLLFSFSPGEPFAWPVALQIRCKKKTESALSEVVCDVFSKYLQTGKIR